MYLTLTFDTIVEDKLKSIWEAVNGIPEFDRYIGKEMSKRIIISIHEKLFPNSSNDLDQQFKDLAAQMQARFGTNVVPCLDPLLLGTYDPVACRCCGGRVVFTSSVHNSDVDAIPSCHEFHQFRYQLVNKIYFFSGSCRKFCRLYDFLWGSIQFQHTIDTLHAVIYHQHSNCNRFGCDFSARVLPLFFEEQQQLPPHFEEHQSDPSLRSLKVLLLWLRLRIYLGNY